MNADVDPFHKDTFSMNGEQQQVVASVVLLLPTIVVACVAAVGATLRRHFHQSRLPSSSSSRFSSSSSSCLKPSWRRRQREEERRSGRREEGSSRRNEESQHDPGAKIRRGESHIIDDRSSCSSDRPTCLSADGEKKYQDFSSSSSSLPLRKSFDQLDTERREPNGRSSQAYIRSAETRGGGGEQGEGERHHDKRTWLDERLRPRGRGREREGKRRERKEEESHGGGSRTREDGGGGGGVADLDATRNEEAVRLKVTEVMEVLFKR